MRSTPPDKNAAPNYRHLETSFLHAAQEGHVEMIRLMLEIGVVANPENELGQQAIALAKANDHKQIVDILTTTPES